MSRCPSFSLPIRFVALHLPLLGVAIASAPSAAQPHAGPPAVYQRHAFEGDKFGRRHRDGRFDRWSRWQAPQVNSGWFQRPYPYHLDYYKMRYGGSYAPYFGNLYGPPQVVTAPPYYGPYYGGFEYANPGDAAYGVPFSGALNGPIFKAPMESTAPVEESELPSPE